MKKLLSILLTVACVSGLGQSVQFRNLNTNQFGSNSFSVSLKSQVLLTNPVVRDILYVGGTTDSLSESGASLDLYSAKNIQLYTISQVTNKITLEAPGGVYAVSGAFTGNGAGLTNLNAANITGAFSTLVVTNLYGSMENLTNGNPAMATNSGSDGMVLEKTGNQLRLRYENSPSIATLRSNVTVFDDFLWGETLSTTVGMGPFGLFRTQNSGGTSTAATGDTLTPGVLHFTTGTSASSAPLVGNDSFGGAYSMDISYTNEVRFRLPVLLATGATNAYAVKIGFHNASDAAEPTRGIYLNYTTNDSHFVFCSRYTGLTTVFATNTTILAENTWYRLKIIANASTKMATFYVNDADPVSLTNYIAGNGAAVGWTAQIVKSNAVTPMQLDLDYLALSYSVNR